MSSQPDESNLPYEDEVDYAFIKDIVRIEIEKDKPLAIPLQNTEAAIELVNKLINFIKHEGIIEQISTVLGQDVVLGDEYLEYQKRFIDALANNLVGFAIKNITIKPWCGAVFVTFQNEHPFDINDPDRVSKVVFKLNRSISMHSSAGTMGMSIQTYRNGLSKSDRFMNINMFKELGSSKRIFQITAKGQLDKDVTLVNKKIYEDNDPSVYKLVDKIISKVGKLLN